MSLSKEVIKKSFMKEPFIKDVERIRDTSKEWWNYSEISNCVKQLSP